MKQKVVIIFLLAGIILTVGNLQYQEIYGILSKEYIYAKGKTVTKEQNKESEDIPKQPFEDENDKEILNLYALSACLMDASNGRVLYSKDANQQMPMASTTKIMTLLVTLENANLNDVVTVSSNAAKQPDVQLNMNTGDQYYLKDLVYSLMLESHNDTAVAIAEHVGGSVEVFCDMMTKKAKSIGALQTRFETPNGLDADGHYTTASDLALIGSYAIKNEEFVKIITTQTHQFNEITTGRSFTVNNKDRFLYMMEGAIGIKTGFTGKAGYCFVGALRHDGKNFVSVVLGSGWPPNKNYKWADTKKLMELGLKNYTEQVVFSPIPEYRSVAIHGGILADTMTQVNEEVSLLLCDNDFVQVEFELPEQLNAPVTAGEKVGEAKIYINKILYQSIPITVKYTVKQMDYSYCMDCILNWFFFQNLR